MAENKSEKITDESKEKAKNRVSRGNGSRGQTALTHSRPRMGGAYSPLNRLRTEFDRLFDDFFQGWPSMSSMWRADRELQPGWDLELQESDDAVVVRADVPGFEPGDIDVEVRGNDLVLCACQSEEATSEEGVSWQRREFHRSISLPAEINAEQIDATYRNGVLTLKLPKTEHAKGRKIQIKG